MRIFIPGHHLSVEPDDTWIAEELVRGAEHLGLYVRSLEHGVYLNVREQDAGDHALSKDGLLDLLREQAWGAPVDEWVAPTEEIVVVGGSFETTGMGGEIVLEVFVTNGHRVANLAGPGPRDIIGALLPAARRLAATLRFE